MMDDVTHKDNDTPTATEEGINRVDDADETTNADPGAAVDRQGVGANPTDSTDPDENNDPKSGHSPV